MVKIPTWLKTTLLTGTAATVTITAPFITKPESKKEDNSKKQKTNQVISREAADFTFHSGISDTTAINIQPKQMKGLKSLGKSEIVLTGKHRTPGSRESDYAIYIDLSIDNKQNGISLTYSHRPKSTSPKISQVGEHLEENRDNTHLYFVLPKEAETGKLTQEVKLTNNKHPRGRFAKAIPTEKSKLNSLIRKYNQQFATDKSGEETSELEKAVKNSAKLLGTKGEQIVKSTIDGFKIVLEKQEEKRREALRQKHGPKYKIIKMPFYTVDGKMFGSITTGRKTTLEINAVKLHGTKNGYIEIPQMTFLRGSKRASLEEITCGFKITGQAKREEVAPSQKQLPLTEIILGEWESYDVFRKRDYEAAITIDSNSITEMKIGGGNGSAKSESKIWRVKKTGQVGTTPFVEMRIRDRPHKDIFKKIRVYSPDLIELSGFLLKRKGAEETEISSAKELYGIWREADTDPETNASGTKNLTYEITDKYIKVSFIQSKRKRNSDYEIAKIRRISSAYLVSTKRAGNACMVFKPKKNGKLILNHAKANIPLKKIR